MTEKTQARPAFTVIHPLDDAPEAKLDAAALGPIALTPQVRWSLFLLRGYMFLMLGLVLVRVLELAGALKVVVRP
jgi:hypothetical protein